MVMRLQHGRLRLVLAASVALLVALAPAAGPTTVSRAASSTAQSLCIGHHPYRTIWYTASCTGHDEPEIAPLSNRAGSAQDLTWTIVLPSDGTTA
jgi:hypothetical protein